MRGMRSAIVLIGLLFFLPTSLHARRMRDVNNSGDYFAARFFPQVEDEDAFWKANILLFTLTAEFLGQDSDTETIKEWIDFQQWYYAQSFNVLSYLLDLSASLEEQGVRDIEGVIISDGDGGFLYEFLRYFDTVCFFFFGKIFIQSQPEVTMITILTPYFYHQLKPELSGLVSGTYDEIFNPN